MKKKETIDIFFKTSNSFDCEILFVRKVLELHVLHVSLHKKRHTEA